MKLFQHKKRLIISILLMVLVAAIALGGTMAYFTDNDEAVNVFTMGKVNIELSEPGWNEKDGENLLPGSVRTKDPTVTAVDGKSYMRIRMEIVDGNNQLITNATRLSLILGTLFFDKAYGTATPNLKADQKYSTTDLQSLITAGRIHAQFNRDEFAFAGIETGKPAVRYYNYIANNGIFDADKTPADTTVLFSNVVIPKNWHNEEIFILNGDEYTTTQTGGVEVTVPGTGYKILLKAEAIQSAEMANAAEAFAALDNAMGVTRNTSGT